MSEWRWCGFPGHFVAADSCRFRLCTEVGDVRVSTVGSYQPRDEVERIGLDRTYETMVFPLSNEREDDGCRKIAAWTEVDSDAYNDPASAIEGHRAMCLKHDTENDAKAPA